MQQDTNSVAWFLFILTVLERWLENLGMWHSDSKQTSHLVGKYLYCSATCAYRSLQKLLKEEKKKNKKKIKVLDGLWRCTVQNVIVLISTHRFCIFSYQPTHEGYQEQRCFGVLCLKALSLLSTRVCDSTWELGDVIGNSEIIKEWKIKDFFTGKLAACVCYLTAFVPAVRAEIPGVHLVLHLRKGEQGV